jgi:sulfur-carrier protein adenylyltransferase/sulfurtransferase
MFDHNFGRYTRQTVLPDIGVDGQRRLAAARVLVVGAGGLGSPVLLYLAAAGVGARGAGGCLGFIDDDTVDLSNLQRQILFVEKEVGEPKVIAAARRIADLNLEVDVRPLQLRVDARNVLEILSEYDIVVDGSDNFATKYLLNDAAVKLGKPVVYGSVLGFEGHASVFWAEQGPCYRCLYPEAPKSYVPNCAEFGTLGGIAGIVGSIQAIEVCKLALGLAHCAHVGLEPLMGRLWWSDARTMSSRLMSIQKRPDCPVCSKNIDDIVLNDLPGVVCTARSDLPTRDTEDDAITWPELETQAAKGLKFTLLDVREPGEWAVQHLSDATLIPMGELMSSELSIGILDSSMPIFVYCQHGIRSRKAVHFLRQHGFDARVLDVDWAVNFP